MLDYDSRISLRRRERVGWECIEAANGKNNNISRDDLETSASDAISDILTAIFGPAGKMVPGSDGEGMTIEYDWDVQDKARAFVQSALDSYFGDAEDYVEDYVEDVQS